MARPSSTVGAIGFSTMTWMPRAIQASAMIVMKMGRRGDGDRIDSAADQRLQIGECGAAERVGDKLALLTVGIGHPDQLDAGHFRQHARMVAAHDADADNSNFQRHYPQPPHP